MIPAPLMVRGCEGWAVNVNALAPGSNTILSTVVSAELEISVFGNTEGGDVGRTVRHRVRHPVGGRLSVAARRIEIPSRAVGECGLKNEE
jgi:hypothetical protein